MNIAEASHEESRYDLLLAKDLAYGDEPSLTAEAEEMARLLAAYSRTFRSPAP